MTRCCPVGWHHSRWQYESQTDPHKQAGHHCLPHDQSQHLVHMTDCEDVTCVCNKPQCKLVTRNNIIV